MPDYRLYFMDAKGHISHRLELDCPDDETAIKQASAFTHAHGLELWQGKRKIKEFPPNRS